MRWHRRAATAAALSEAREIIVRPKFRRSITSALIFVAACAAAVALGGIHATHRVTVKGGQLVQPYEAHRLGSWIAIGVACVAGGLTVRLIAAEVARIARLRGSVAAANTLNLAIQIVGYIIVLVVILGLMAVRVESVLLSGAITSVVIGLAAQQSLSNAIAGIVLLISRPFVVGDYITLRAGGMGGQYDGEVTAISLMFTTLETTEGPVLFPNSGVLNAATGRRERPSPLRDETSG